MARKANLWRTFLKIGAGITSPDFLFRTAPIARSAAGFVSYLAIRYSCGAIHALNHVHHSSVSYTHLTLPTTPYV